jgi:two-component system sensor histidine kinase PilS (NtrC family)
MSAMDLEYHLTKNEGINAQSLKIGAAWFRLIFLASIYLTLLLVQVLQGDFLHLEIWQSLNVIMLTAFALHLPIFEALRKNRDPNIFLYIALAFDLFSIGIMMHKVGVPHAVFIFINLILISYAGFVFGKTVGLAAALWSALIINLIFAISSSFQPQALFGLFFLQNISGLLVGYLGGKMGDEIQFVTEDVAIKKQVIRKLYDFNDVIVENIPSTILTLNESGQVLRANKIASRLFSDLALVDKNIKDINIHVAEAFEEFKLLADKSKSLRTEVSFYNYRQEKQIFEIIFSFFEIQNQQSSYILLIQNLTELRNIEQRMRQKDKLAAVGQLAAGIAHEIRNPLASISGSVQLLSASLQTQSMDEQKLFKIIIKEIDRLNNLISEFLDYVRPDVLVDDPVNIVPIISEVLDMVQRNPKIKTTVEQKRHFQSSLLINGQAEKLKQAFLNIIINAYQAMESTLRPELTVSVTDSEDKVHVTIKDNGIGISSEHIQRIFEPFHTTKPSGTGLGLAITHKIFETHKAEVRVHSQVGHGTTFEISFPIKPSPERDDVQIRKLA